jgi:hypothetical protein
VILQFHFLSLDIYIYIDASHGLNKYFTDGEGVRLLIKHQHPPCLGQDWEV